MQVSCLGEETVFENKARDTRAAQCTQVHEQRRVARNAVIGIRIERKSDCFGLYGQVTKRIRWMPRQQEAMKDVAVCEKLR